MYEQITLIKFGKQDHPHDPVPKPSHISHLPRPTHNHLSTTYQSVIAIE